jgi:CHAD domain-containing protein
MANGKWIDGLAATTPISDACRRVLTLRLESVRDYLPPALHQADNDREHVHQLRVATRRAGAAIDVYAACIPPKLRKTARTFLRNLRRVAGEARDCDVFVAGLIACSRQRNEAHRPALDLLLGEILAQRARAQKRLRNAAKDYPFSFDRFLAETVAAVQKPDDGRLKCLADLARPAVHGLLQELENSASGDLLNDDQLHATRIVAKRMRYAMELFAQCFPPAFRDEVYPLMEALQEILGVAHDSHIAVVRLEAVNLRVRSWSPSEWKRLQPGLAGLLRYHRRRQRESRKKFKAAWEEWRSCRARTALLDFLESAPTAGASPHPEPGLSPLTGQFA